jgi:hypothetical protein
MIIKKKSLGQFIQDWLSILMSNRIIDNDIN